MLITERWEYISNIVSQLISHFVTVCLTAPDGRLYKTIQGQCHYGVVSKWIKIYSWEVTENRGFKTLGFIPAWKQGLEQALNVYAYL